MSTTQFHTMTYQRKWALGIINQFSCLLYSLGIYGRIRIVRGNLLTFHRFPLTSSNLGILGKVENDRTRTTAAGNIESTAHSPSHILWTTNLISPFRDRLGNTHQINLLERIRSQGTHTYLTSNNHDRCRIHHGISNTSQSICCSRTTGHECHAHFAADSSVALCSMSSSLLVTYQDVIKHLIFSSRVTIQ